MNLLSEMIYSLWAHYEDGSNKLLEGYETHNKEEAISRAQFIANDPSRHGLEYIDVETSGRKPNRVKRVRPTQERIF